jgi:hypothetical protein
MGKNYFDQFDVPAGAGTTSLWNGTGNFFDQFDEVPAMQLSPPAGGTEVAPPGGQDFISLGPVGAPPPRPVAPTAPAGGNYFDRFDLMAQPPALPAWPDWMTGSTSSFGPNGLPDWMTECIPAPASPAGGNFFDQFDEPAPPAPSASAPRNPAIAAVDRAPTASQPMPRPLYSQFIHGIKNAFGGDYGRTRQWFANNGYGGLLQSDAPSQPSMFDRYWTMLGQYDADRQQADAARKVGFGAAFAREGLRGLAGITEYENRLLSPAYWGIDAASRAITGYNPNLSGIPDSEAEQRNSLAIQPYEELTLPGQIGAGFGQALPMAVTAPLAEAALPAKVLATAPEVAPTLWNATRAIAAGIPRGVGAMMPSAALVAQDAADQGGSVEDQLKAASLTMAMGAIPMLAESGASSLPLRVAERGTKSAALAVPVNAWINNLQDPNRRTIARFTPDDIVSAIPQVVTGALAGGREVPFRKPVEAKPLVANPALRDTTNSSATDSFLDRMRVALDGDEVRRSRNVMSPRAEFSAGNPYRNTDGSLRIPERASSRSDTNLASYEAKMKAVADNAALADAAYNRLPDTLGGKVIGTDLARALLDEYAAGREGRMRYVNATGRVAQAYAKDRLWRELAKPQGRSLLIFTAGGVAAGKSSALTKAAIEHADLVFDGTLRESQWAIDTIRFARDHGWDVKIEYMQRPMPLVIRGAIKRAQSEGRWGLSQTCPRFIDQRNRRSLKSPTHSKRIPVCKFATGSIQEPRITPWFEPLSTGLTLTPEENILMMKQIMREANKIRGAKFDKAFSEAFLHIGKEKSSGPSDKQSKVESTIRKSSKDSPKEARN